MKTTLVFTLFLIFSSCGEERYYSPEVSGVGVIEHYEDATYSGPVIHDVNRGVKYLPDAEIISPDVPVESYSPDFMISYSGYLKNVSTPGSDLVPLRIWSFKYISIEETF